MTAYLSCIQRCGHIQFGCTLAIDNDTSFCLLAFFENAADLLDLSPHHSIPSLDSAAPPLLAQAGEGEEEVAGAVAVGGPRGGDHLNVAVVVQQSEGNLKALDLIEGAAAEAKVIRWRDQRRRGRSRHASPSHAAPVRCRRGHTPPTGEERSGG
jgi:hypothetical protein